MMWGSREVQRAKNCSVRSTSSSLRTPSTSGVGASLWEIGAAAWTEARRLARRELVSSVLDFSDPVRRMMEGPPFMMFLEVERISLGFTWDYCALTLWRV